MRHILVIICLVFILPKIASAEEGASKSKHGDFALNLALQNARLNLKAEVNKENLTAWKEAFVKDPGLVQKLRSSRIARESQQEVLLLLRGADLGGLSPLDSMAFGEVIGALYIVLGDEFCVRLVDAAIKDPQISMMNKIFLSLRTASSFRFNRDYKSTIEIFNLTINYLLRTKSSAPKDPRILPYIRTFAEAQDLFANVRWLFFYNSLYLTAQRFLGPEPKVDLKPLYLRHLISMVTLGRFSDAVQFGEFLSGLVNPDWSLADKRALYEAQIHALALSGNKSAPSLADRFIEQNQNHSKWTVREADIALMRKASAHLYLGEVEPAKAILEPLSAKNLNDREFKLNLLRTRSRLYVYLERWPEALADIQAALLLEPASRASLLASFGDIFALFVKDKISLEISWDQHKELLDILQQSLPASETLWSIKPQLELAIMLHNRGRTADLKSLIRYANKQYAETPLKPYLAFFDLLESIHEISPLPQNQRARAIPRLEARIQTLRSKDAMLSKYLSDTLILVTTPAKKLKKGTE